LKFSFLLFFISAKIYAASCCGGGANFPGLITGESKSQLSTSISHSSVIGHTDSNKKALFHSDDNKERSQTFKIVGAFKLNEDFQAGLAVPVVRRSINRQGKNADSTGLGDVEVYGAYEFLPELTYSAWKPKGYFFTGLTLPTAPSIHEAEVIRFSERARGKGFVIAKAGLSFFKINGNFDFQFLAQIEKPFSREFENTGFTVEKDPGFGWSSLVSMGYSPFGDNLRLGLSVAPSAKAAVRNKNNEVLSDSQFVWDTSLSASYLVSMEWTVSLTYNDQTILGPSKNAILTRSSTFLLQKRWSL
jgi:hypothetical protein